MATGSVAGIAEVGDGGALSNQAANSMLPFVAAFIETSARDPRALWSSFSMIVVSATAAHRCHFLAKLTQPLYRHVCVHARAAPAPAVL